MIEIPLSRGLVTIVDDEDAHYASLRWCALRARRTFYAVRHASPSQFVYLHREILAAPPNCFVDHKDGNGLNNRRTNIRIATPTLNRANQNLNINNTSGYKGVFWERRPQKWRAQLSYQHVKVHLGLFDSAQEAAYAYDNAARIHFGAFAALNFPVNGERKA